MWTDEPFSLDFVSSNSLAQWVKRTVKPEDENISSKWSCEWTFDSGLFVCLFVLIYKYNAGNKHNSLKFEHEFFFYSWLPLTEGSFRVINPSALHLSTLARLCLPFRKPSASTKCTTWIRMWKPWGPTSLEWVRARDLRTKIAWICTFKWCTVDPGRRTSSRCPALCQTSDWNSTLMSSSRNWETRLR